MAEAAVISPGSFTGSEPDLLHATFSDIPSADKFPLLVFRILAASPEDIAAFFQRNPILRQPICDFFSAKKSDGNAAISVQLPPVIMFALSALIQLPPSHISPQTSELLRYLSVNVLLTSKLIHAFGIEKVTDPNVAIAKMSHSHFIKAASLASRAFVAALKNTPISAATQSVVLATVAETVVSHSVAAVLLASQPHSAPAAAAAAVSSSSPAESELPPPLPAHISSNPAPSAPAASATPQPPARKRKAKSAAAATPVAAPRVALVASVAAAMTSAAASSSSTAVSDAAFEALLQSSSANPPSIRNKTMISDSFLNCVIKSSEIIGAEQDAHEQLVEIGKEYLHGIFDPMDVKQRHLQMIHIESRLMMYPCDKQKILNVVKEIAEHYNMMEKRQKVESPNVAAKSE